MDNKLDTPRRVYQEIRDANPNKPFGSCWDSFGHYCGDGVWCDPDYVDMPGEYEFLYKASERRQYRGQ